MTQGESGESDSSTDKHTENERGKADGFDQTAANGPWCHLANGVSRKKERKKNKTSLERGCAVLHTLTCAGLAFYWCSPGATVCCGLARGFLLPLKSPLCSHVPEKAIAVPPDVLQTSSLT